MVHSFVVSSEDFLRIWLPARAATSLPLSSDRRRKIVTKALAGFVSSDMAKEIERKFLVQDDSWRGQQAGKAYRQGYLSTEKERTVRIRTAGDQAFMTVKGVSSGATRSEYEYEIPVRDANEMLDHLCKKPLIEKTRYRVQHDDLLWEIDEFAGENGGLVLAEVELKDENQEVSRPKWVGREVTDDPRYFNVNLVAHPFSKW